MTSINVGNAYVTVSARFDKSWSSGVLTKANAVGDLISKGISRAVGAVSSSIDAAIGRVDTMNNFPRIMENMGVGADAAKASIDRLSKGIDGLPTALDTAVLGVERFTSKNGDVDKSTDYFLALNDAILAGGASSELQSSAIEQLSQSYAKGKMDMMEWRSLQQAMPAQLNQIAKAMGVTTDELGEGLRKGEISMDSFMDAIVRLDKEGGDGFASFADQAKTATGGIGTALTNVQNRVNKAVASIIDAIGAENISGAINAFSSKFKDFAQPVIDFINGFKSSFDFDAFAPTLSALGDAFDTVGKTASKAFGHLGEALGNLMTAAGPVIEIVGKGLAAAFSIALNAVDAVATGLNNLLGSFDLMSLSWGRQMDAISTSGVELERYVATIEELAGKEELTAVEQEKLRQAVEGYNKITGDSLEVIDAQKGELSKSTEEIRKNAEAWLDNAYKQAYYQQVSDIIADTVKKQQELAEATERLTETELKYQDVLAHPEKYPAELYSEASNAVANDRAEVKRLTSAIDENNRKLAEGEERLGAVDSSTLAYIESNSKLRSVLERAGVSSTQFSNYLTAIGKSEKNLEKMSPKVAEGLANISKMGNSMGEGVGKVFSTMAQKGENAAKSIMDAFKPVGPNVSRVHDDIGASASKNYDAVSRDASVSSARSQASFSPIASYIGGKFNEAQGKAASALSLISSKSGSTASSSTSSFGIVPGGVGGRYSEAYNSASGSLSRIISSSQSSANSSVGSFNGLGGRISAAIGTIKFPQPHIWWSSIEFLGRSVSIPHINWYAQGGFVDGATLIGAGEAGAEMILPKSGGLMSDFASAVTEEVDMGEVVEEIRAFRREIGPIISEYTPGMTVGELSDRIGARMSRGLVGSVA